jgi:predicted metal-dependent HD superfamily phosphohydrolase
MAVKYLILCTIKHTIQPTLPSMSEYPEDNDVIRLFRETTQVHPGMMENLDVTALFLDLDLSILGGTEEEYDAYAREIREEYCQYSWEDYCNGRSEVMNGFLRREQLYFTDHFYNTYEAVA